MARKLNIKEALYKKTGVRKPDAKSLMLDHIGMLPMLMGAPVSITKALQQLGKSAVKIRSFDKTLPNPSVTTHAAKRKLLNWKLPTSNVRAMAANIRRSPTDALEPLTSIGYKRNLERASGMNIRDLGAKTSSIALAPKAGKRTLFHEYPHDTSWATRGDRTLQGYLSDLLETSTEIGNVRATKLNKQAQSSRGFYRDQPVERHARDTSRVLSSISGKISNKKYKQVFIDEAKDVLRDVKERAPTIYTKALKDVAKSYKREAAFKRYVKQGIQDKRPPGTFNEWYEGLVTSPKSKVIKKTKKKLTPGEMARIIQDKAEATGPPRYLRRKAD